MRTRLTFVLGFAAGYVVGSRAGRERYEQIVRVARKVSENPTVQETTGVVQAQASGYLSTAKERVADRLETTGLAEKLPPQLTEKVGGLLGRPVGNGGDAGSGTGSGSDALASTAAAMDPVAPVTPLDPVSPTVHSTTRAMPTVSDDVGTTSPVPPVPPVKASKPKPSPYTAPGSNGSTT